MSKAMEALNEIQRYNGNGYIAPLKEYDTLRNYITTMEAERAKEPQVASTALQWHKQLEEASARITELEGALVEAYIPLLALDVSVKWELSDKIKASIKKARQRAEAVLYGARK